MKKFLFKLLKSSICLVTLIASGAWGQEKVVLAPPAEPAVKPEISLNREEDTDGDRLQDSLSRKVDVQKAARTAAKSSADVARTQAALEERIPVQLVFKSQITQAQIDAFIALGGEITYIYKAVSYGWTGSIPSTQIQRLPGILGESLVQVAEPQEGQLNLLRATQNGRARPIWTAGFAGSAGFDGDPNITIAILDSGVDSTHTDLAARQVFAADYVTPLAPIANDPNGHGSHVAGIALGSGASGGAAAGGTLRFTQTGRFNGSEAAGIAYFHRFTLPAQLVPINLEARWPTGGQSGLALGEVVDSAFDQLTDWQFGASPLTGDPSLFTPGATQILSPMFINAALDPFGNVVRNTALREYAVLFSVGSQPAVADGFARLRGVAPGCRWANGRVANETGNFSSTDLRTALDDMVVRRIASNIRVINMSLGLNAGQVDTALRDAVNTAVNNGIVVVAAAGNSGASGDPLVTDPGRARLAITVAAANQANALTHYTSHGRIGTLEANEDFKPDLMAPGGSTQNSTPVLSVDSNTNDSNNGALADQRANDYVGYSGTSMAAPFVAGAAALVLDAMAQQPGFTWNSTSADQPRFVKMLLCATSAESGVARESNVNSPPLERAVNNGRDRFEGHGMMNPDAAIEAIRLTQSSSGTATGTLGALGAPAGEVLETSAQRVWARNVTLLPNRTLSANLTVPATGDFDLYLYSAVPTANGTPVILASSTVEGNGAAETLTYYSATVPTFAPGSTTANAYLVIKRVTGAGAFTLNTGGSDIVVEVAGTVIADGGSQNFAGTGVGSSSAATVFTLRNAGTTVVSGLGVTKDGLHPADFNVTGPPVTSLNPGESTTFTVSFAPTAALSRQAALHVSSNVSGAKSPYDITVTGTGQAAEIEVQAPGSVVLVDGTSTVPFGTVNVGDPSVQKTFTIRNLGNVNLTGIAVSVDGPGSSSYALNTSGTLTALAPGTNTTFQVTYTPAAAAGLETAAIHITSSDGDESPFDFAVIGTSNAKPVLSVPASTVIAEATAANGAVVTFPASASDEEDGSLTPVLSHASGATFPMGNTTVTATVTDSAGATVTANFIVRVQDTLPPAVVIGGPYAMGTTTPLTGPVKSGTSVDYVVTYTDPNFVQSTLTATNVTLTNTGGVAPTKTVSGSGATRVVRLAGLTGNGTSKISIAAGTASDSAGNTAPAVGLSNAVTVDNLAATVSSVTSTTADGAHKAGAVIDVRVNFSETVTLTGAANLKLNSHASTAQANYVSGSGSQTLVFQYTVAAGQNVADLNYAATTSLTLTTGSTLVDLAGNNATRTLPALAAATSLAGSKALRIDTAAPVVTAASTSVAANTATISISGSGFESVVADNTVTLSSGAQGVVTAVNAARTLLTVSLLTVPEAGPLTALVFDAAGNSNASPVTVASVRPVITVSSSGIVGPASTVTISGYGFSPTAALNSVIFSGAKIGTFTPSAATSTSLSIPLTGMSMGVLSAKVTSNGVSSGTTAVQVGTVEISGQVSSFNPNMVSILAVQPNGKLIALNTSSGIVRLNPDGSADSTFTEVALGGLASGYDVIAVIQPDGKILIGGRFSTANGISRVNLVRVSASGAVDTSFNAQMPDQGLLTDLPNPPAVTIYVSVHAIALQKDGRILVGGTFTSVGTSSRRRIARLNTDGTLDLDFDPSVNIPDNQYYNIPVVSALTVQEDGKILIGGYFRTLQPNGASTPVTQLNMARLNEDGTIDTSFNNPQPTGTVADILVDQEDRIVLGGQFGSFLASTHQAPYLARLLSDGQVDTSFSVKPNLSVSSVALQADGKLLAVGTFTSVQPMGAPSPVACNLAVRLTAAGTVDSSLSFPVINHSSPAIVRLERVLLEPSGGLIIDGVFTQVIDSQTSQTLSRNGLYKMGNDPGGTALDIPSLASVQWLRSGSYPDVSQVSFEQSIDSGATWTLLGWGQRISNDGSWEITGLSLPSTGPLMLRARGRPSGNAESLVESYYP